MDPSLVPIIVAFITSAATVLVAYITSPKPPPTLPAAGKRLDQPDLPSSPEATGQARKRNRRWRRVAGFVLVVMAIGIGVSSYLYRRNGSPEVVIQSPSAEAGVGLQAMVRGTSRHLPREAPIWVVLYVPSVNRYYPVDNPADRQPGGGWSTLAQFGIPADSGRSFEVLAVVPDRTSQEAFRSYLSRGQEAGSWPGLERLPPGAVEYDRVTVTRQ